MFYVAYTVPSAGRPRPVTFLFNGGPGSSTMWLHMGSFGPMKVDASIPETIAGPAVPLRPQSRHVARHQRPRVHRRADDRPVARRSARPSRRTSSASTRTSTPSPGRSSATSPNTAAGTAPSSSSARATARRARRGWPTSLLDKGVQLNGIVLRLDGAQLRRFPGRPDVGQLPADLCGRRLVSRQDRSQAGPLEHFLAEAQRLRQRALCGGAAEGRTRSATRKSSRSRSRWRASPACRADYILRSNLRVHPDRFRRELLRDRHQIIGRIDSRYRRHRGRRAGEAPTTTRRRARYRRLRRRAQRLSVPRPRLQDAARPTGRTIMPGIGRRLELQHKHRTAQQIADTSVDLAEAMRAEPADEGAVGRTGSTIWRRRSTAPNMNSGTWRWSRSSRRTSATVIIRRAT